MKGTYLIKEWRTDNRPVPMTQEELTKLIKKQAVTMRSLHENGK